MKLQRILLVLAGLILVTFVFRTPVARWYVNRKVAQFNASGRATLEVGKVRIHGLASVLVTGITLKPATGDTLLKIDSAFASVSMLKLLAGRLALHRVRLVNTTLLLERNDTSANYRFLLGSGRKREDSVQTTGSYAATADRLMRFVFDKIPLDLQIRNFRVTGITDGHAVSIIVPDLHLADQYFRAEVTVTEDTLAQKWTVAGRVDNPRRTVEFRMYSAGTGKIGIPFLGYKWNLGVALDTLAFSIGEQEGDGDRVTVSGFATLSGLRLDHRRIAAGAVTFDRTDVRYTLNIGTDFAEVDSATQVTFNRISFHPWLRVRPKPSLQVALSVHRPSFPAQDLFASFPEGLFTNLDGIRVRGNLSWYLDFAVDLAQPDSLKFSTGLDRQNFGVISYGNANLSKLNEPFEYTAYDHDLPVRTFTVGPENPMFRTIDRISPLLRSAVLTSEDGSFYLHRGFLEDAFRESIITNIKERRFARGGSTISMQLVKNVFLSRNKTVGRKVEEALLVWLIETQGITTKDRMFEVYLNIIEWGPMVYGAGEAAHYYFGKEPSKLTLAEAIFMASVIPRPKYFKWEFDPAGHLRESMAGYYRLVSEKMLAKGWITNSEAERLVPDVDLKGAARALLSKADTVPPDTISD